MFHLNSYTVGFGCANQISRKAAQVSVDLISHEVLTTEVLIWD